MKNSILIIITFLFSISLQAQHKISGIISDKEGQPVEYANVLLLHAKDSTLAEAGMTEENGMFEIKGVPSGEYILQASQMGFTDYYSDIISAEADIDLGTIEIQDAGIELDVVEVTYKKPLLEQRGGTMIVNVANSIVGSGGTAIDVLKKVPGIIVIGDKISLAGQQGVNIMIDGRPTHYVDMESLLKDLPSDAIEKIEVIQNPDARFDAEGQAGIINIVLKKNVRLGMNGRLTASVGYGELLKYRTGLSLNYRNKKFNFTNSISFNRNTSTETLVVKRYIGDQTYSTSTYDPYKPYGIRLRSGVDYSLSDRHKIGTAVKLFGGINRSTKETSSEITSSDGSKAYLNTDSDLDRTTGIFSSDSYYQFEIDTSGQQLSADLGFFKYARHSVNDINTYGEGLSLVRQQDLPSSTSVWAAKIDYVLPIWNDHKLTTGIKYSHAKVDNDLQASILDEGTWVNDAGLTNHFIYKESIGAAYVNWNYAKDGWGFSAGLRYEDSRATGYSVTLDSLTERNNRRLFPSASVNFPIAKSIGGVISYSHRIRRPRYSTMNPFVYFMDPYTYEKGNPFLKPELTHSTKFSLTYDGQPFFNVEYKKTRDEIQMVTEQDDETGIAYGFSDNLNSFERIGTSMFFPLTFAEGLSGYGGVMANYDRYRNDGNIEAFDQSAWSVIGFLNAEYAFDDSWSAEYNGWIMSGGLEGIMRGKTMFGMSAGVQYKFLDGKARLKLNVSDFLFNKYRGTIQYENLNADIISDWERPVVNLSFSYKFGNNHLKKEKGRSNSTREEQRRNN